MGRFVTLDGRKTGPAVHVVDPGVPLMSLVLNPNDLWRTQPAVRKVVNFAARNIASIPMHVYRRVGEDDRQRVMDSRAARLLRAPAPYTTPFRFWHTIHVDGLLHDRWCFVLLEEAADGSPEQLYRIPPSRFRIERDEYDNAKRIIVWNKDGEEYHLSPDVCVFDSGYTSGWGDPVPPADTLADMLLESDEARKYRRELLENGARVPAVIERPKEAGEWSDKAWNRFRTQFANYRAGGGKAGGVPVLEDGMKLTESRVFDPQSLQVLEARKLHDAEVASFYHIPPELIGAREGTFANLDAFRQMLWSISLGPLIVPWEQSLIAMLLPLLNEADDDVYLEAMVEAKLRGSFEEQMRSFQSAVGAPFMVRNEARSKLNMKRIEGGDDLVTPLNVVVGGLANPRDTGSQNEGPQQNSKPRPQPRRKARPDDLGDAETERTAMIRRLENAWKDQAAMIRDRLGDGGVFSDVEAVYDRDEEARAVAPIIQQHMQRLAEIGAWDVLAEWNPDADGWGPEMIEAWIRKAAATNAAEWSAGMTGALQRTQEAEEPALALETLLAGTGLAAALAGAFAAEARSFGGMDAARKSGLGTKTWHTTSKTPRAEHAAQNGVTVGLDDTFPNGLRWPGDHTGDAEDNANCTCNLTYGKE